VFNPLIVVEVIGIVWTGSLEKPYNIDEISGPHLQLNGLFGGRGRGRGPDTRSHAPALVVDMCTTIYIMIAG
jgi:hypothetical protein